MPPNEIAWLKEYVDTVNEDQMRALKQANEEREKSAKVLRQSLIEEIQAGDENLKTHIDHQRESTMAALESLRAVLAERDKAIDAAQASTERATDKAFDAAAEKSSMHNDLLKKMDTQTEYFLPRETFDVFLRDINEWRRGVSDMLAKQSGSATAQARDSARTTQLTLAAVGFLLSIVIVIANAFFH